MEKAASLAGDQAQEELHQSQIEHATSPCDSLDDLRSELVDLRRKFVSAAATEGSLVLASGTYPGAMGQEGRRITSGNRYEAMAEANAILAREHLICGCHIHVSVPNPERAIFVMNRIRGWLPPLLALSANSPFWEGEDTGFASYRTEVWSRWPTSGPPGHFESHEEYQRLLTQLVDAGVILDKKMAYWDVRPSEAFPTLEIRVSDVMPAVDDVIAVAGLARALVALCDGRPDLPDRFRAELLRAANWQSARAGLSGSVLWPADGSTSTAPQAVATLLQHVAPLLAHWDELHDIQALIESILHRGNGADRQRAAFDRNHRLSDVIDSATLGRDGDPQPPT